jgi:hypothetical protein
MVELITNRTLFPDERRDQIRKIFKLIGVVTEENFPGYHDALPDTRLMRKDSFCCIVHSENRLALTSLAVSRA